MDNKQIPKCPIPPPPPLTLSIPKLTDQTYQYVMKKKHYDMIEDKKEYNNVGDELKSKYKQLYDKHQNIVQSISTGQGPMINVTLYKQCYRCQFWILKSEQKIHLSCHPSIVMDNILLGDRFSSRNRLQLIQRNKVTHILNCANELQNNFQNQGIKYYNLTLKDNLSQQPIEQFKLGAKFIKQSVDEGGRVFVHCMMGKSRSVSSILVYMLVYQGIPLLEGLKKIKEVRPVAQPNMNYMKRLKEFQKQFLEKNLQ